MTAWEAAVDAVWILVSAWGVYRTARVLRYAQRDLHWIQTRRATPSDLRDCQFAIRKSAVYLWMQVTMCVTGLLRVIVLPSNGVQVSDGRSVTSTVMVLISSLLVTHAASLNLRLRNAQVAEQNARRSGRLRSRDGEWRDLEDRRAGDRHAPADERPIMDDAE